MTCYPWRLSGCFGGFVPTRMVDDGWRMADGGWPMSRGYRRIGHWSSAIGHWPLAFAEGGTPGTQDQSFRSLHILIEEGRGAPAGVREPLRVEVVTGAGVDVSRVGGFLCFQ